jgi:threonine dehydrogenase-like Zn-dependent dehydrogenase
VVLKSAPVTSWEYALTAPRTFRRRSRRLADLPEDWVRVRFLYCGLCGSDLSTFEGRRAVDYPVSLGHEFIAEVWEVGAAVKGLAPGDVVTSDLNYRCGACDQCRARRSHLCRVGQSAAFSNRAFAQFGDLHAGYLLRIDGSPRKHLALSEPLSCVLHAKDWAAPQPGDRVLVVGAGGLGSCLAFALSSASRPVSFEITDHLPSRVQLIERATPLAHGIREPDGEYDVVFDLSGSESGLRSACAHTRPGGRLCTMSHLDGYSQAEFLLSALTRRDITFTVSYLNGERETLASAARALAQRWGEGWEDLLEVVPIASLRDAFATRRTTGRCKTVVEVSPTDHS